MGTRLRSHPLNFHSLQDLRGMKRFEIEISQANMSVDWTDSGHQSSDFLVDHLTATSMAQSTVSDAECSGYSIYIGSSFLRAAQHFRSPAAAKDIFQVGCHLNFTGSSSFWAIPEDDINGNRNPGGRSRASNDVVAKAAKTQAKAKAKAKTKKNSKKVAETGVKPTKKTAT